MFLPNNISTFVSDFNVNCVIFFTCYYIYCFITECNCGERANCTFKFPTLGFTKKKTCLCPQGFKDVNGKCKSKNVIYSSQFCVKLEKPRNFPERIFTSNCNSHAG